MKTVGIIGPLTPRGSGNHAGEFLRNVSEGIEAATELIRHGFAPYCPHLDFQYVLWNRDISDVQLKNVSLEWITRCDVVLALPGFEYSLGAQAEYDAATMRDIPVFHTVAEVIAWSEGRT